MTGSNPTRRPVSPAAVLAAVGFSVFVAADDLTVVTTMLRPIIGDLGLVLPDGLDQAAWIVNAYLVAFVAVMPLAGRLSDLFGRRRTFTAAYLLFLIGSIVIPLAPSYNWFLAGRVLTAIGGGAMVPVALAVVGDVYPEHRRARALGTLGAIETMGWVWGPLYGAALVHFLSWRWQFWLNLPLTAVGLAATWWALRDFDEPAERPIIDWAGAALLTVALVSLNVALLGSAEIQSVTGLDELTGGAGPDLRWLFGVALVTGAGFLWRQRTASHPLIDPVLLRGRNLRIALVVNFAIGAALAIAMVDVPLFINTVELNVDRAAVVSGWILSALTASMALASYIGGRVAERRWARPPVLAGTALAVGAFAWMGTTWAADTSYIVFGLQLAVLGAGLGLTFAPTTTTVVDAAPADQRGAAASLVMVVRLLGLSVGLSALTAWGLARFNALRTTLDLPPITDPDFQSALTAAQQGLTAQAIAETFVASALVITTALIAAMLMRRQRTSGGVAMTTGNQLDSPAPTRRVSPAAVVLGVGLVVALGLSAFLFTRLTATNNDIAELRAELAKTSAALVDTNSTLAVATTDMQRVEAGAALFASQVTGITDQIVALEPQVSAGIDAAIEGLEEFGSSTVTFDVSIDQSIPISTEFVIDRTVTVPIKTTIPISETFETTVEIDTRLGFSVPVDITVPVEVEVPLDLQIEIPVKETIPINETFEVDLNVPVEIDISQTDLARLTTSLADGLESFRQGLTSLG